MRQALAAIFHRLREAGPAVGDELPVGVGELPRHPDEPVLDPCPRGVANAIDRRDDPGGKLAGLFQHGLRELLAGLLEARQLIDFI